MSIMLDTCKYSLTCRAFPGCSKKVAICSGKSKYGLLKLKWLIEVVCCFKINQILTLGSLLEIHKYSRMLASPTYNKICSTTTPAIDFVVQRG